MDPNVRWDRREERGNWSKTHSHEPAERCPIALAGDKQNVPLPQRTLGSMATKPPPKHFASGQILRKLAFKSSDCFLDDARAFDMLPLPLKMLLQPELTQIGRLPARASLVPYPSVSAAKEGKPTPRRQSLDGVWDFQLVARPDDAPEGWHMPHGGEARWREINVPGVWTRQDTGDDPHYTNMVMPWACQYPPDVPEENPTGLYRRIFTVAPDWVGQSLSLIHI